MSVLHSSPFVLNSFLSEFAPLVISRGSDLRAICASAGLTLHDVTGSNQLIPFDRFIALLETASNMLRAENFALLLAARQDLRTLGPVSLMLRDCETVGEAISVTVSHLNLLVSGISIETLLRSDTFVVEIDVHLPDLKFHRQFRDYLVGSTLMVVRSLSSNSHSLLRCQLYGHQQTHAEQTELAERLGCKPEFGADKVILQFPGSLGRSPLAQSAIPGTKITQNVSVARQQLESSVATAIVYLLVGGTPSIERIASLLGYSERTLRRRLTESGLSYKGILEAVRLEQANKYLSSTHYRLADIASLLGFANQSAFSRFYTRCTGLTPSRYRAGLVAHSQAKVGHNSETDPG